MPLYTFKSNVYIAINDLEGLNQEDVAEMMSHFSREVLLPYLQKWSKSKTFSKEVDNSFAAGFKIQFLDLEGLMRYKK
jgi:hypothetical protein